MHKQYLILASFVLFCVSIEPQKVAIGTNYSRVCISKEINSKDRDSFWKKAEEEERMRVETERGKQINAKLDLEKVCMRMQMNEGMIFKSILIISSHYFCFV